MFALKELCEQHEVNISAEMYDLIRIADLKNSATPFCIDRFEDLTEPDYPFDNED